MEFKLTSVDIREAKDRTNRWFDPKYPTRISPMIMKSLPNYLDLFDDKDLGRKWSRARAKAMREAIMTDPDLWEIVGEAKLVWSRTLGCRCGCSGGFSVVGKRGKTIYVELEQVA